MPEFLAWPAMVLILGFSFMLLFKRGISSVLDRTKKVGKGGLEMFDVPQLSAPAEKPDPLADFMGTYDNPLLREQEAAIVTDLKTQGFTDPAAAQKVLVRSLAGTQILLLFERLQSSIWASQIEALTYLNSRPNPSQLTELLPFYEKAKQGFPAFYNEYTFDSWLGFLTSWLLVDKTWSGASLSKVGREFLKWRLDAGKAGPYHG